MRLLAFVISIFALDVAARPSFSLPPVRVSDEGSLLPQRSTINFSGTNISCADDSNRTTCTASEPAQVVDVAPSGRQYTSIKSAVDSIVDSASTKPYVVRVFPGVYTESPFTIPSYVNVQGQGAWFDVQISTNNNAAHFITLSSAAVLTQVSVNGPTDTGMAAVDVTYTSGVPAMTDNVVIRKGYYGIYMHPASGTPTR